MDFSDAAPSMPPLVRFLNMTQSMTPLPTPTPTKLAVLTVPAFKDNYLWLIHDGVHAAVVDPGDGEPILEALRTNGLTLTAILLTHHHADHIGGVPRLLEHAKLQHADVPVFGPRNDGIAAVTHPLGEGDRVQVPGLGLSLSVLDVPGHTLGHIAYVRDQVPETDDVHWLFCGDTLFGAGCGRLFEGTPAQMADSLGKLAALPDDTLVYCAHEYTLSNLRFAEAVEPDNRALKLRVAADSQARGTHLPTIPSTIAIEKATNPFLRYREPAIGASLVAAGRLGRDAGPIETFTALREWKNVF
jgi:hydroxyacylglutathione hydrolase